MMSSMPTNIPERKDIQPEKDDSLSGSPPDIVS